MILTTGCPLWHGFCSCAVWRPVLNRYWLEWRKKYHPHTTTAVVLFWFENWTGVFWIFFKFYFSWPWLGLLLLKKQNIRPESIFFSSILCTLKIIVKFETKSVQSFLSTFKSGVLLLEYKHNKNLGFQRSFSTSVSSLCGSKYFGSLFKPEVFYWKSKQGCTTVKQTY